MTGRSIAVRRRRVVRRGSTYLAVLLVSMVVAVIGLSGLAAEHLRLKASAREGDWIAAQTLAASAVEHALHFIATESVSDGWRTAVKEADQDVIAPVSLGGGTAQWSLRDHQGHPMSSDPAKTIYVVGTGTRGPAQHTLQVVVRPAGPSYSSLTAPVVVDNMIDFTAASVVVQCDGPIVSNGDIDAIGCGLFATEFQAVDQITGGAYYGVTLTASAPRGVPSDPSDYYKTYGTPIDGYDLPGGDPRFIRDVVLSPNTNPYGAGVTNPEGIYVLDAHGKDVVIKRSRILGTLLVRGLGQGGVVTVQDSVLIEPSVSQFPSLLVDGKLRLQCSSAALSEAAAGVNFNPVGTPFASDEDALTDDVYPSLIRGLVYSNGHTTIAGQYNTIEGLLIAKGKLLSELGQAGAVLDVTFDQRIAENPPPGFFVPDGTVRIGAFTWAQADP